MRRKKNDLLYLPWNKIQSATVFNAIFFIISQAYVGTAADDEVSCWAELSSMLSIFILIRGTSKLFVTFVKGFLEDKKPSCNRIASLELCWIFSAWALPETCCNKAIVSDGATSATKALGANSKSQTFPFFSSHSWNNVAICCFVEPYCRARSWKWYVPDSWLITHMLLWREKKWAFGFLGSKKLTYVLLVCVTWGACPLWLQH